MLKILTKLLALGSVFSHSSRTNSNCDVVDSYKDPITDIPLERKTLLRYSSSVNAILVNEDLGGFEGLGDKKCDYVTHEIIHRAQLYQGMEIDNYRANFLQNSFEIKPQQRESLNQRLNEKFPELSSHFGKGSARLEEKLMQCNHHMALNSVKAVLGREAYNLLKENKIPLDAFIDNLDRILPQTDDSGKKVRHEGVLHEIMQEWESYSAEKIGIDNMNIFHHPIVSHSLWQSVKDGNLEFPPLSTEEICERTVEKTLRPKEEACEELEGLRITYAKKISAGKTHKTTGAKEL